VSIRLTLYHVPTIPHNPNIRIVDILGVMMIPLVLTVRHSLYVCTQSFLNGLVISYPVLFSMIVSANSIASVCLSVSGLFSAYIFAIPYNSTKAYVWIFDDVIIGIENTAVKQCS